MPAAGERAARPGDAIEQASVAGGSVGGHTKAGPVTFLVPEGWRSEGPRPPMRIGQWSLPRAEEDAEDGQVVLYYFGAAQGGGVQANLDRWIGQMIQPDGKASRDVATTDTWKQDTVTVTTVRVPGTFAAESMPGAGDRSERPGFLLLAAVVETPHGTVFFKGTGPAATMARWEESFGALLRSVRPG